jgi:hypothetical protein
MLAAFGGSLVIFIVFVSFAITSSMSYFIKIMEGQILNSEFLLWLPDLVHVALTVCAIVVMVLLLLFADITLKKHRTRGRNVMRRWLDVNLKLIGLMLFFIAFVFLDVMGIAADYACLDGVFSVCNNIHVKVFRTFEICYRLVRIMHALAAVSFCYKLRDRQLVRRNTSLIGLAIMQSATLGLWVDFLINESLLVSQASNRTQSIYANACSLEIAESQNRSNGTYSCVTMQTEMYQFLQEGSPYLFPCSIEFLMLFAECIAGWFFSSVPNGEQRQRHGQNESTGVNGEGRSTTDEQRLLDSDVSQLDECTGETVLKQVPSSSATGDPVLRGEEQFHRELNEITSVNGQRRVTTDEQQSIDSDVSSFDECITATFLKETRYRTTGSSSGSVDNVGTRPDTSFSRLVYRLPWFALAALLIIIGNVMYVSMGIAAFFSEYDAKRYTRIFSGYRIGYWLVLTGSTIVGYRLTKRFVSPSPKSGQPKLTGFEYFVTVCIFGQVIYLAFTITANIGSSEDNSPTFLYFVEEVLNMAEVIAQTVFYFYAKGVPSGMRNTKSQRERRTRQFLVRKKFYETILILFVVSNIALWIEDSFVETRNVEKSFQMGFYAEWPFIYDVVNPMMLLFRFNSILLFTELYLKNPKKSQTITEPPAAQPCKRPRSYVPEG